MRASSWARRASLSASARARAVASWASASSRAAWSCADDERAGRLLLGLLDGGVGGALREHERALQRVVGVARGRRPLVGLGGPPLGLGDPRLGGLDALAGLADAAPRGGRTRPSTCSMNSSTSWVL